MRPLKQAVYSSRSADKFVMRLPDGMRIKIAVLAKDRHQSMNSYIIAKLERAIAVDTGEHTPYTPVIGMVLEHKDSGSLGVLKTIAAHSGDLFAQIEWIDLYEGAPEVGTPVLLTDLRPFVV